MIELAESIEGLDYGTAGGSQLRKDSGGMAEKFSLMSINATRAFGAMEEAGLTVASIRKEQLASEGGDGGRRRSWRRLGQGPDSDPANHGRLGQR